MHFEQHSHSIYRVNSAAIAASSGSILSGTTNLPAATPISLLVAAGFDGHQLRGRAAVARNHDLRRGGGLDRFNETGEAGFGLKHGDYGHASLGWTWLIQVSAI